MDIRAESDGSFKVAYLAGEPSGDDEQRLREALEDLVAAPHGVTAVDLAALKTISSGCLSALIHLVTRSRLAGGQVFLVSPSPFVREILEITRLDRLFDICANLDEARRRMAHQ